MPADKIISKRLNSEMEPLPMNMPEIVPSRNEEQQQQRERPRRGAPPPLDKRRQNMEFYLNITKTVVCLSIILMLMYCMPQSPTAGKGLARRPHERAILLWNVKDKVDEWKYLQCGCILTTDRDFDGGPIDAVVVIGDLPYNLDELHLIKRTPNFLLVFADKNPLSRVHESPLKTMFNFTMTYRHDSDVVWKDLFFTTPMHSDQKLTGLEDSFITQLSERQAFNLRQRLETKTRLVFYMVYDVNEYSLPESLYLQELRKYMELSAYISCHGYYDCALYKFMLIFEPSACPDYVHPDFYNALTHNVVPVVVGGSNISHLVPPGSYISSADFESPRKLAEHLEMLSTQPQLYEQFFLWQAKYQLHRNRLPFCTLCRKLQQPRVERRADEFANWWNGYQCSNRTDRLTWSN